MLFRVPVGACYFEVVVCENITYENLRNDFYENVYFDYYINNGYTIKFDCVASGYDHIWTRFICEKHSHDEDGNYVYLCQDMSLLTKITFINKTISNKNLVNLYNIYIDYINNYKFTFLSNDMYRILFNLKNDWAPYGNVIRNFKFFSENMRRKVSNLDQYVLVYKNSIVDHHILELLDVELLDPTYHLNFTWDLSGYCVPS